MNALYEESDDLLWDLRCSAQYDDDFVRYLQHVNPEALSSPTCVFKDPESMVPCHKPSVPRQCPQVDDKEVIYNWHVYEDLLYYAFDNATWSQYYAWTGTGFPYIYSENSDLTSQSIKTTTIPFDPNAPLPPGTQSIQVMIGGKQSIQLSSSSISQFLSLMTRASQQGSASETREERQKRIEAKRALRELLGLTDLTGEGSVQEEEEEEEKEEIEEGEVGGERDEIDEIEEEEEEEEEEEVNDDKEKENVKEEEQEEENRKEGLTEQQRKEERRKRENDSISSWKVSAKLSSKETTVITCEKDRQCELHNDRYAIHQLQFFNN